MFIDPWSIIAILLSGGGLYVLLKLTRGTRLIKKPMPWWVRPLFWICYSGAFFIFLIRGMTQVSGEPLQVYVVVVVIILISSITLFLFESLLSKKRLYWLFVIWCIGFFCVSPIFFVQTNGPLSPNQHQYELVITPTAPTIPTPTAQTSIEQTAAAAVNATAQTSIEQTAAALKPHIESEYPEHMKKGNSSTVRVSFVYREEMSPIPTIEEPGNKAQIAPAKQQGTPVPVQDAFGNGYDTFISAKLYGTGFDIDPQEEQQTILIDQQTVIWYWSVTPKHVGKKDLLVKVSIKRVPKDGGTSLTHDIGSSKLKIHVYFGFFDPKNPFLWIIIGVLGCIVTAVWIVLHYWKRMAGMLSIEKKAQGIYAYYETGLQALVDQIQRDGHAYYKEILVYQQRLLENINKTQRFGDTMNRQAERAEIIYSINDIALAVTGISFIELCTTIVSEIPETY